MTGRLSGKTAIVTGGTRGIGLAIVRLFIAEGACVLAVARSAPGEELRREFGHDRCMFRQGDVTVEDTARLAVAEAISRFGSLDVLVNNAGIDWTGDLIDATLADLQLVTAVNLFGPFLMLREAARAMRQRGGSIVNVTSRTASAGIPTMSLYSASKGALASLTRAAAVEWASLGIRVNAVAPGLTDTPLARAWFDQQPEPESFRKGVEATIPQRRLATPEEVAAAVLFLASDDSRHVTGVTLAVDGGYTAQ
jgi:NAD(P)-dependent dehydrogenase (short-subunit alcohol dehydrogenase family)